MVLKETYSQEQLSEETDKYLPCWLVHCLFLLCPLKAMGRLTTGPAVCDHPRDSRGPLLCPSPFTPGFTHSLASVD